MFFFFEKIKFLNQIFKPVIQKRFLAGLKSEPRQGTSINECNENMSAIQSPFYLTDEYKKPKLLVGIIIIIIIFDFKFLNSILFSKEHQLVI